MLPFVLVLQLRGPSPPLSEVYVPDPPAEHVAPVKTRRPPSGFGRIQIGLGPPAFSKEASLLQLEGYRGGKLWIEIDAGYMTNLGGRHFGAGLWSAFGRWYIPGRGASPALRELDYLVGAELVARFGSREIALLAAPRAGVASGSLDLGGDNPSRSAFVWGGQVSAVSSRYHLSASASFLRAIVSRPGDLGRSHDLGGLYFTLGGILDDG